MVIVRAADTQCSSTRFRLPRTQKDRRLDGGREPDSAPVVEFGIERVFKRVGYRGVEGVEVAEVISINQFNRVNERWQKGEVFRVVLEDDDAGRFMEFADMVGTVVEGFKDGVGSTEAVREFW
jgi:hypothetical protein